MASDARDVAAELSRLLRGEIDVRDFPWLSEDDRRRLGALGMAMLDAGKHRVASAAFDVLIDLEPDVAVHHLMAGHSAALGDDVHRAYEHFNRAIGLSAADDHNREVAAEAFLARGDLLLRLGRVVEARADLADAMTRMSDAVRRKTIESFLGT